MRGRFTQSMARNRMPARPACRRLGFPVLILLAGLVIVPSRAALADAATEQQLRAALQQATSQIAALQNQVANLQAQEAPDQAMIASLQTQLQTLKSQALKQQAGQGTESQAASKAAQQASDKLVADFNHKLAAQQAVLGKIQTAYRQAATAANTNAAANRQLSTQLTALHAQLGSCVAKNAALYKTGNEILDQLAQKGNFWTSFADHEPFTGIARVKLQNIFQDDQNKLDDSHFVPTASGQ